MHNTLRKRMMSGLLAGLLFVSNINLPITAADTDYESEIAETEVFSVETETESVMETETEFTALPVETEVEEKETAAATEISDPAFTESEEQDLSLLGQSPVLH